MEPPAKKDKIEKEEEPLPEGWCVKESHSYPGRKYYFCPSTKQSSWERPTKAVSETSSKEVKASHILIKHAGSRKPSSWREQTITLSKDEARSILSDIRSAILNGKKTFETVAAERSDCSSARKQGDLGFFERGKMQKAFEKVAFSLEVGDISGITDTDSGLHIIKRTA